MNNVLNPRLGVLFYLIFHSDIHLILLMAEMKTSCQRQDQTKTPAIS
jgi:hypothetical protein